VALRVDPHSDVPPSRQIVEAFLDEVASGAARPGDRLPSVRTLAVEAVVNPNTVGKAYRDLEAMGVVEGRNGSGVFVTPEGPAIAREQRHRATLAAFRRAAREALRAGHDVEDLGKALAASSRGTPTRAGAGENAA
jgi:GntR family transcriptional regulator